MTVYALATFFVSIAVLLLGNFVYYQDKNAALNRMFTLFSASIFWLAFTSFMRIQAESFAVALFWSKVGGLWPFSAAILLHFILIYIEKERFLNELTYALIYIPAAIFSFASIFFTSNPVKGYWGYTYGTPVNTTFYGVLVSWASLTALFGAILCIIYFFKLSREPKKKQALLISVGLLIPIISGTIELVLTGLGIIIPETTPFLLGWLSAFIAYAIWKYELFVITPEKTVTNIVSIIPDILFLLDSDRRIAYANKAALDMLGFTEGELIGKHARIVFSGGMGKENDFYRKLIKERVVLEHEDTFLTKNNVDVPVILSGSVFTQGQGNVTSLILVAKNISRRKEMEKMIYRDEKRFRAVVDTAIECVISIDSKDEIIFFNKAAEREFGYRKEEVLGKELTILMPGRYKEKHEKGLAEFINKGTGNIVGKTYQVEALRKDGTEFPVELSVAAWNPNGDVYFTGMLHNITDRKEYEEYIKYMAYHDRLTDLPNRRLLEERAEQDIAIAMRENKILAVLYLDIDSFKSINDFYGHDAGDFVLKEFAKILRQSLRKGDTVARLGGDEFLILLPTVKMSYDAILVAKKILEMISKPLSFDDKIIKISSSIGISMYPHDGEDTSTLIKKADAEMFKAKKMGGNAYSYSEDMKAA